MLAQCLVLLARSNYLRKLKKNRVKDVNSPHVQVKDLSGPFVSGKLLYHFPKIHSTTSLQAQPCS